MSALSRRLPSNTSRSPGRLARNSTRPLRKILIPACAAVALLGAEQLASAQTATWVGPATGAWGTQANWSNNAIPTSATDVLIDQTGTAVTVSTGAGQTRNALNLTLDAGDTVEIDNNSSLNLAGNLTLNGTVRFLANANQSFLRFSSSTATISGTGVIDFNYTTAAPFDGRMQGPASGQLTNNGTIRGSGTLDNIRFTNSATGLLENYQTSGQMYLDANNSGADLFVNQGTIRALTGSLVTFAGDSGGNFVSTGGNIQANGAGAVVRLINNANITGGNYSTTGGGEIVVEAGHTGNASPQSLSGTWRIRSGANLNLSGTMNNNGAIQFSPSGAASVMTIAGALTLNGTGSLVGNYTGAGPGARIDQSGANVLTLGSGQTVSGVVQFNNTRVVNNGLIDANDAASAGVSAGIYVDSNNGGADLFVNNGTMRSSGGGLLMLVGDNGGNIDNRTGTISAIGDNSLTELSNNVAVRGGTYSTTGTGRVRVRPGHTASISDTTTITAGSTFLVPSITSLTTTLNASGSMNLDGTLQLDAAANVNGPLPVLNVNGPLTLSGSGAIVGTYDGTNSGPRIDSGASTLTIGAGNSVRGVVHFNNTTVVNNGLIDADNVAGMYIDSNNSGGARFVNNGTMRARNAATMVLAGDNGGDFINNGTILSDGAGSVVELFNNVSVTAGNWTSTNGGLLRVRAGTVGNLNGPLSITSGSTFSVPSSVTQTTLNLSGAVTLAGTLTLDASGAVPLLNLSTPVTLSGSGTVLGTYGGVGPGPRVDAFTHQLTIGASNSVRGVVFFNNSRVLNNGLIDADNAAGMYIDPNNGGAGLFVNNGTMRSSAGGLMVLTGDNGGDFVNNGVISSIGANSITELHNNVTVTGGNWTNSAGGVLRIRPGQPAHLNNPTIPAGSKFDVPSTSVQTTLNANGAYALDGTLELNANGGTPVMSTESPVTLSGTGKITGVYSGAGPGPRIDAPTNVLTVGAGNTIEGVMYFNNAKVTNNGLIHANQPAGSMYLDPSSAAGVNFVNNGTMRASNGATMQLVGDNGGPFGGAGPLIADASSTIQAQNSAGGDMGPVSGDGTYRATSSSNLGHQNFRVANLEATNSGRARVTAGGGTAGTSRISSLTITTGGKVDLTDHDMVYDHTGTSPIANVRGLLQTGYNNGPWNGSGIVTSNGTASGFAIGYGEASAMFTTFPAVFSGQTVDNTTLLLRFTRFGDATLDGTVNSDDFNLLATNFGLTSKFWRDGDFNYNGTVNSDDFNLLAGNFGLSASAGGPTPDDWAMFAAAVPEPAAGLSAACILGSLFRRRRRN